MKKFFSQVCCYGRIILYFGLSNKKMKGTGRRLSGLISEKKAKC
jgi:hypothetical protein